jgi:hypothetical protein
MRPSCEAGRAKAMDISVRIVVVWLEFYQATVFLYQTLTIIRILDPCGLAAIISRSRAESTEFETSWGRAAPPCNQAALREMKGC